MERFFVSVQEKYSKKSGKSQDSISQSFHNGNPETLDITGFFS